MPHIRVCATATGLMRTAAEHEARGRQEFSAPSIGRVDFRPRDLIRVKLKSTLRKVVGAAFSNLQLLVRYLQCLLAKLQGCGPIRG